MTNGPYYFDRLDQDEMIFYKERGLIHKNFIYDHPFWFSRDPLPFFLQSLKIKDKKKYLTWNLKGESSYWWDGINSFDVEPRFWDGECNRRLTYYELKLAKQNKVIHENFVYDKLFWSVESEAKYGAIFTKNNIYNGEMSDDNFMTVLLLIELLCNIFMHFIL